MPTLIMCKGLPASGKTTFAKQYVLDNPGTIRVNKDDLRQMAHAGKWSKSNEADILLIRDTIVWSLLLKKQDVIVDDTNLAVKHEVSLRKTAEEFGAEFEIKDFTEVPLEECIKRDQKRANYVGEKVIRDMYNKFLRPAGTRGTQLNPLLVEGAAPYAVIFDLDGTLACIGDRSPYDGKSCGKDQLNESVAFLARMYRSYSSNNGELKTFETIIFSGRNGDSQLETEKWLVDNNIFYDHLYMRNPGDFRKDAIIKEEMFNAYIKGKYNVIFAVDDRNQVVELWRSLGITCLQVAPGDF